MDQRNERRQEKRLSYPWPVWFSEDFAETLTQGLMIDVSSGGIAFRCEATGTGLDEGRQVTVRFSIPRFEGDDPTATLSVVRIGCVCRKEQIEAGAYHVAVQFDAPLALCPTDVSALKSVCSDSESL